MPTPTPWRNCFSRGLCNETETAPAFQLIFDCWDQIAELTAAFPLDPGDVIFTGTPDGVGGAMKLPRFLQPGDRVRVEIQGVGVLDNVMCAEQRQTVIE